MKTENLTREEAMKAMIDGHRVRRQDYSSQEESHYYYKDGEFYFTNLVERKLYPTILGQDQLFCIIQNEPKLKEVVMYSAVYDSCDSSRGYNLVFVCDEILSSAKESLSKRDAIGYTEVKVLLKEKS